MSTVGEGLDPKLERFAWRRGPSRSRLFTHALAGWGACTATLELVRDRAQAGTGEVVHALFTPLVFAFVAWAYFRRPPTFRPLVTGLVFAGVATALDLALVGLLRHADFFSFASAAGSWIPSTLIVVATVVVGDTGPEAPRERHRERRSG